MTQVAVLGAGGGGRAAVAELQGAGHDVRLWNRRPATIAGLRARGTLGFDGVLGTGTTAPLVITTDLAEALEGARAVVVCLPGMAHQALFEELVRALAPGVPLILNPGHTGAALQAREVWRRSGAPLPPVVELSTLTYVARVHDDVVTVSGRAKQVRGAALPGGEGALEVAMDLFPGVTPSPHVLWTSLSNVNLVLHPPGALLGLSWVEATRGDFTFYVEGLTPSVGRVMDELDRERLAVAAAFGVDALPLAAEMAEIGTAGEDASASTSTADAVRAGDANRAIKAPDSVKHRYYAEDFPFGLLPFTELAKVARVDVPVASALLDISRAAVGRELFAGGRDAAAMGIRDMSAPELLDSVTAAPS